MTEPQQWKLTELEQREWLANQEETYGEIEIVRNLAIQMGRRRKLEAAMWESLKIRLGLPKDMQNLVLNAELGIVWVKGQVPELKDKEN